MRTWQWTLLAGVVAVGMFFAGTFVGCASDTPEERKSVTKVPEPEDVLTEDLMIPLAQAKNYHHIADVYLKEGKTEEATLAIEQILSLKFPAGAPEAEDIINDARARLGKLYVMQSKLDEAMRTVQAGIDNATRESFFVANQHTVRGEILEARAIALDETNDDAAKQSRRDAIEAFSKSNEIHERLLKQLVTEPAP